MIEQRHHLQTVHKHAHLSMSPVLETADVHPMHDLLVAQRFLSLSQERSFFCDLIKRYLCVTRHLTDFSDSIEVEREEELEYLTDYNRY